jgi:Leucine-rich repeat (LRR) protein
LIGRVVSIEQGTCRTEQAAKREGRSESFRRDKLDLILKEKGGHVNNDDHHNLAALIASIGSTSPAFDEDVRVAYDEDGHIIKLNLGALHLSALPDELWQFTHLQELQLFDNELSDISSGIGQLTALEDLSLAGAQLRSLPDTLWRLANLQSLNLGWNEDLRVLPPEIGQLRNVRRLGLFHMNLRELPIELFKLTQLEALDVRNNHLTMFQMKSSICFICVS